MNNLSYKPVTLFTRACVLLWLREHLHSEEFPPTIQHQEKLQTTTPFDYCSFLSVTGVQLHNSVSVFTAGASDQSFSHQ